MIDPPECLDRLSQAAAGEETDQAEAHGAALAAREGFAVVETSPGRLCHWTRLSRDGEIEDYANRRSGVSKTTAASSISRLAGLFDPCVLYRVEVVEPAHA